MKLQLDSKYTENKYTFPSENIPQTQKDRKEYFRACANAIVWKYVHNKTYLPYTHGVGEDSVATLRSYLYGTNSVEKYKDILAGPKNKQGQRTTTMNISWRMPQILTEKMDVVRGYIMKLAYDVTTTAIDMQAKMDKDMIVANMKLMVDDKMNLIGVGLNKMMGRDIIPQDQEQIPFQNERQVEMFANIGGVLLEQEASIKILLDETLLDSDWEGIKDKLVEDILALAICGTKSYNEAGSDVSKARYVDMERAIVPYSNYNDFRDITWGGEIRQMTGLEIMRETGMEKEEFLKIAKLYSSDQKSPQYIGDFYYQAQRGYSEDGFGMNLIDSLVFDVADVCWVGTHTDTITKVSRKKEGNTVLNKVSDDYEVSEKDKKQGKEVEKYSRQCVYKAKLIVGTDYVFDYGKEYNQTYVKDDKGKQRVVFPYRFNRTGSTSLVSRAIGFIDDLALAVYKKRQALKKLPPPPGVYIEESAFQNVTVGGNKMNAKTCMKLFQDEGYLIGNTQNLWGTNTVGRSPISEIPTGIITQLTLFNAEIEFNIAQIERCTGVNEIFAGATPQSETGLGVANIAINATQNALFPVIKTYENCFEGTMRVCAKKWQVSAMHMDTPGRKKKPHDRALGFLKVGKGMDFNDFLIKIQAGATEDEKLMLMQDIRALQDVRRQSGSGGIRSSDYVMLFKMIKAGQIDQARLMLAQVEEYIEQMDQAKQDKLVQDNMQSQMASNQQAAEANMEETQTKEALQGDREAKNIELKGRWDMLIAAQKAKEERKNIAISNVYGWGSDNYNKKVKK